MKYRPFKDKEECWNEMLKHSLYAFFQPRISVEQEEVDIKATIDEEYEHK